MRNDADQLLILHLSHGFSLPSPTFAMTAATSSRGIIFLSGADFEHIEPPEINLNISSFAIAFISVHDWHRTLGCASRFPGDLPFARFGKDGAAGVTSFAITSL